MTDRLTQQELESYLWGAAVILRGHVDAGDYKQFAFPLIFFKRLSDVWDEDYAAAIEESEDEAYVRAATKDVGKKLQSALAPHKYPFTNRLRQRAPGVANRNVEGVLKNAKISQLVLRGSVIGSPSEGRARAASSLIDGICMAVEYLAGPRDRSWRTQAIPVCPIDSQPPLGSIVWHNALV